MIYDSLDNLHLYGTGNLWKSICQRALSLDASTRDGFYPIKDEVAFCRVMEYPTKFHKDCSIEGHQRYVDIQFTLGGAEGIDVFSSSSLSLDIPYNDETDVAFFTSSERPVISTQNHVGFFTLLLPHDIHRPQVAVEPYVQVKKAVIKVDYNAFCKAFTP